MVWVYSSRIRRIVMGIFDLPAPVFYFLDDQLSFLPAFIRLFFWGVLAGVLGIVFYALISPQNIISEIKGELREAQGQLAASDESFDELWQLIKKTLSLSLKHLGFVFVPALVSSLPIICILAWASNQFSYNFPAPGEHISLSAQPASAASTLAWSPGSTTPRYKDSTWQFEWPAQAQSLAISDGGGKLLLTIPPPAAIPQIHKQLWWNSLLGNPAGYLPPQSTVESVVITLPEQRYLPFGPAWMGNWLTLFFAAAMFSGLLAKWLFKIH